MRSSTRNFWASPTDPAARALFAMSPFTSWRRENEAGAGVGVGDGGGEGRTGGGRGEDGYSFVACLSHVDNDYASLSRRSRGEAGKKRGGGGAGGGVEREKGGNGGARRKNAAATCTLG